MKMIQTYTDLHGNTRYSILRGQTDFKAQDINFLKGEINYTQLYLKGQNPVISSYNLKLFQDRLPVNQFVRPNKSTLLNVDFIAKVLPNEIILKNKERVKISRRRLEHVQKVMDLQKK